MGHNYVNTSTLHLTPHTVRAVGSKVIINFRLIKGNFVTVLISGWCWLDRHPVDDNRPALPAHLLTQACVSSPFSINPSDFH